MLRYVMDAGITPGLVKNIPDGLVDGYLLGQDTHQQVHLVYFYHCFVKFCKIFFFDFGD
jgi:hypothetical protein